MSREDIARAREAARAREQMRRAFWFAIEGAILFAVDCIAAQMALFVVGGLGAIVGFWPVLVLLLLVEYAIGMGVFVSKRLFR